MAFVELVDLGLHLGRQFLRDEGAHFTPQCFLLRSKSEFHVLILILTYAIEAYLSLVSLEPVAK